MRQAAAGAEVAAPQRQWNLLIALCVCSFLGVCASATSALGVCAASAMSVRVCVGTFCAPLALFDCFSCDAAQLKFFFCCVSFEISRFLHLRAFLQLKSTTGCDCCWRMRRTSSSPQFSCYPWATSHYAASVCVCLCLSVCLCCFLASLCLCFRCLLPHS